MKAISETQRSIMGRNLSPMLWRELANLDKDADSCRSAMKALKTYVKELDSNKAIHDFLAQVSETKETGALTGECTISLYEVLARVHGVNIVPQIDRIMASIIKTLASSAGSFLLQQACSKVVPAIARYGIDPTTPDCRSVNSKLWSYENGGVDISLKDGLFSEVTRGTDISDTISVQSGNHKWSCNGEEYADQFAGFSKEVLDVEYQEALQAVLLGHVDI